MDNRNIYTTAALLICLLFSNMLLADGDYWRKKPRSGEVKFKSYNITKEEIVKSAIDVVIQNNWVITEHTENDFIAVYIDRVKLKVSFTDDSVLLEEIPASLKFEKRWMKSLEKNIDQKFQYYHYVRLMTSN